MNVNKNNFQKESSIISESDIVFDKDKEIKYKRGKRLGVGGFGEVYEFIEIPLGKFASIFCILKSIFFFGSFLKGAL